MESLRLFPNSLQRLAICGVLVPDDRRGWRCFCPWLNFIRRMNLQKVLQNGGDDRAKVCAKEYYIYRMLAPVSYFHDKIINFMNSIKHFYLNSYLR